MILALRSFGQFFRDAMMGPHPALARLARCRMPWKKKAPAQPITCPAFDFIRKINHSYITCVSDRWGEFGKVGRGLRFTPSGMMRLGQAFGFIEGLYHRHPALAVAMAQDLIERLDGHSTYGGWLDKTTQTPAYITQLSDDGTFLGWSMLRYAAVTIPDSYDNAEARSAALKNAYQDTPGALLLLPHFIPRDGSTLTRTLSIAYKFSHNGGFLYSGPGGDEVWAVNLGSLNPGHTIFWSTHT